MRPDAEIALELRKWTLWRGIDIHDDGPNFAYACGYIDGLNVLTDTDDRWKNYSEYHKGYVDGKGDRDEILAR